MNSNLSDALKKLTPSQKNRISVARHSLGSRVNQSHHNPRTEKDPRTKMQIIYMQYIGLQGEVFINEWLFRNLELEWDATRYWTSRNRNQICPNNPFVGKEGYFADFPYQDTKEKLKELLITHGFIHDFENWSERPLVYHHEVKTIHEPCKEPFYMSNNLVEKAREYTISCGSDKIPTNVYVLLRVYNLEKENLAGFTAYADSWAMYMNWELSFKAVDIFMVKPNEKLVT